MDMNINVKFDQMEVLVAAINRLADALTGSKSVEHTIPDTTPAEQPAAAYSAQAAQPLPNNTTSGYQGQPPMQPAMPPQMTPAPTQPYQQQPQYQQPAQPLYQTQPQYQSQQQPQMNTYGTAQQGMPAPTGVVPGMQPAGNQQPPVAQPMAQPGMGTLPTSHVAQTYTQEQLAVAMATFVDSGKGHVAHAIMQQFGVSALIELPPDRYPELAVKLREAGAPV